ncbi:hypothetical protein BUY75_12795 [Staphylococcus epidermidis]|nr:hypothetical protein BUY75_12795 [Staphylococcus epidermidis]
MVNMIPNPNAPDEYKYETDYRKIPRKYLNPKIPQGRGKIKWQAFATLPQQFEILEQIIKVHYTHYRAHERLRYIVCRLLLEKKIVEISLPI